MSRFTRAYNHWLIGFVTEDHDDEETVYRKKVWVSIIVISFWLLLPNTLYFWQLGLEYWTWAGICFLVFHAVMFMAFHFLRSLAGLWITMTQFFYLFFSLALVVLGGGLFTSGGTLFIGLIGGPVSALIMHERSKALYLLIVYISLVILAFYLDPLLPKDPDLTGPLNQLFFLLHYIVITLVIFFLMRYHIIQSQQNREKEQQLLRRILPEYTVREILETGHSKPRRFEEVTLVFTDFVNFTNITASIPAHVLIRDLNDIFYHFDQLVAASGLEKIKTIGDGYLYAGGLTNREQQDAEKCVLAAMKMLDYLHVRNQEHAIKYHMRVGIHTGPVIAGLVGDNKFTFDVFGDTVNLASRLESAGEAGKINVSAYTYELIKNKYQGVHRGTIETKGKGAIDMYFIQEKK